MRMICRVMMAASLAALVAATPASADDKDASAPKEKKICKSEKITGSLTRVRRICLTEAEWKALHDQTRDDVAKMQGRAAGGQCIPSDPMSGGRC